MHTQNAGPIPPQVYVQNAGPSATGYYLIPLNGKRKRVEQSAKVIDDLIKKNTELERQNKRLKADNQLLQVNRHEFEQAEATIKNVESDYSLVKVFTVTAVVVGGTALTLVAWPIVAPYLATATTTSLASVPFTAKMAIPAGATFSVLAGKALTL